MEIRNKNGNTIFEMDDVLILLLACVIALCVIDGALLKICL
jgi:hypothetical protein